MFKFFIFTVLAVLSITLELYAQLLPGASNNELLEDRAKPAQTNFVDAGLSFVSNQTRFLTNFSFGMSSHDNNIFNSGFKTYILLGSTVKTSNASTQNINMYSVGFNPSFSFLDISKTSYTQYSAFNLYFGLGDIRTAGTTFFSGYQNGDLFFVLEPAITNHIHMINSIWFYTSFGWRENFGINQKNFSNKDFSGFSFLAGLSYKM